MDGLYAAEFVSDDLVALKVGSSTTYGQCTAVLLFDVNTSKAVSEPYGELTPDDSGVHRVSFLEESYYNSEEYNIWGNTYSMGYVDNDGNVLAEYAKGDEGEIWYPCSRFDGDYAAVTKNGEVYLIDRNMNIVSDTFNCDVITVQAAGNGLYLINASEGEFKGTDYCIISYAENSETTSDTSDEEEPTGTPSDTDGGTVDSDDTGDSGINNDGATDDSTGSTEGSDENGASDTDNAGSTDGADDNKTSAETGAAGVAGAAALAVTAIGAVVLSRRKK